MAIYSISPIGVKTSIPTLAASTTGASYAGGEIHITSNYTSSSALTFPSDRNVVIESNGGVTGTTIIFNGNVILAGQLSGTSATFNGGFQADLTQHFSSGVKVYGLKGESRPEWWGGISDVGTDSTDAFHSAMNASKMVLLSSGTYLVNVDLTLLDDPDDFIIRGVGPTTILKGYDDSIPVISGIFTSETIKYNMQFVDFSISQTGGGVETGNHGISFKYAYNPYFSNVKFINLGGYCVKLERVIRSLFVACEFYKGSSSRGTGGISAEDQSHVINTIGGKFTGSGSSETTAAITIKGQQSGLKIFGSTIESWSTGVVLDNTNGKILDADINAHFEDNVVADVQVGVKDSSASNYISGVSIAGSFPGPVVATGHTALLWGRYLYGIDVRPHYVTNRTSIVDLYGNVSHFGNKICPSFHDSIGVSGYVPLYSGTLVGGVSIDNYGTTSEGLYTLGVNDTTPSVMYGSKFKTGNTSATTITALDDGVDGQEVFVVFNDNNTTIKFSSGGSFSGNGSVDLVGDFGDSMRCTYVAALTKWCCTVAVD